jgi:hypothetical protein
MYITIVKSGMTKTTYKVTTAESVVNEIKSGKYESSVNLLRSLYNYLPLMNSGNSADCQLSEKNSQLPKICFAAQLRTAGDDAEIRAVNRLVLVEINSISESADAIRLREAASLMPQTYMAFLGADAHSVKIVSRYEVRGNHGGSSGGDGHDAEYTVDEWKVLQLEAYRKIFTAYQAQLGVAPDNLEPTMERSCLISSDSEMYYDENAVDFMIDDSCLSLGNTVYPHVGIVEKRNTVDYESKELLPGKTKEQTQRIVFQLCMQKALDKCLNLTDGEYADKALGLLAAYCHESGLPMEMAIKRTCYNPDIGSDEDYVRLVFGNVYNRELKKAIPFKHVNESALLTYKTWALLNSKYQLFRNTLTGQVYFRRNDGFNYSFVPLTERRRNSITIDALKMGLNSWDKDMKRFIESDDIKEYDPIDAYLSSLPAWDGTDRISELARRVPNDNPDWEKNFHTWMLSMVAQWRGRNNQHGNATIPLLIGFQGSGKSTFCSRILPTELLAYYNDKLDFANDNAVQMALSKFALLNIDEFDSLKKNQQPMLKYLAQKSDVKVRTLYTQDIEEHRRFASFVGTTNNVQPLTDDTGSRRFICAHVTGIIDNTTPVAYKQLYAQALAELAGGARYWFNAEENVKIQEHNERFCTPTAVATMMQSSFVKPSDAAEGEVHTLDEIIAMLKSKYRNLKVDGQLNVKIGHYLTQMGYPVTRGHLGRKYRVLPI